MASYQDRIAAAHQSGHLFAHMCEHTVEKEGGIENTLPIFEVMNNTPSAQYDNGNYGSKFSPTPHGIIGLATTALKKKYPVPLFSEMSYTGLLMDTAKPLLVSHYDSNSKTRDNQFSFRPSLCTGQAADEQPPIEAPQQRLLALQEIPFNKNARATDSDFIINLDMTDMGRRFTLAEGALTALWHDVRQMGWDTYSTDNMDFFRGMNEVDVAAKLQDICGIMVYNNATRKRSLAPYQALGQEISYADSVKSAVELKKHLIERHPALFDASLPIMSYEISRHLSASGNKVELVELTPDKIQDIMSGRTAVSTYRG